MRANYHTHTWRCNHATGTEEEYVKSAVEQGFEILGFSDHTPQFFRDGYTSKIRMDTQELPNYCRIIRDLRDRYCDQIRIHVGLEVEYYPAIFSDLVSAVRDQGVEYLLLGQHFLGNEQGSAYAGAPTMDETILRRYCEQSMEAMQTGVFTYFAHPDLIKFQGDHAVYRKYMRRLCQEAKSCGLPLEMNLLGYWSNRNYPDIRFWSLAAEEGCQVVIGWDAHAPEQLCRLDAEGTMRKAAKRFGLDLLDTVEFKTI
jgi:histidinol-phosphatase (PHP family)